LSIKIIRVTTVPISFKVLLKDQLKFMSRHYEIVAVSSEGKELSDVARDEGIRTVPLNMSRQFTPLRDFVSLMKMILLFRKESPDIVHSHTPKAGIVAMLAAFICNVPNRLHTVAGLPVMNKVGLTRVILLAVEWLTCKCATKVYPNSKGLEVFLTDVVNVPSNKLKVLGSGSSNGVDTRYFNLTPDLEESSKIFKTKYGLDDCFVFTFIGRIVKDKGIEELMDAYARLSSEVENVRLVIVGWEEPLTDPISNHSQSILKNNTGIVCTGFMDDIRPSLGASDCLILASYREGFPNVVMQAACLNIPSIVSNINGCNEIIQDGSNGLVVEPKSADALYYAMKRLESDRGLLSDLAAKSRHSVVEKYDREKFQKIILAEYQSFF
jgi:glycosyltransferase involved in cell wall biosynthesis